jgi:hypothetical protein
MDIKVAIITDLDIKPFEWYTENEPPSQEEIDIEKTSRLSDLCESYPDQNLVKFVSPNWTLEYEIALGAFQIS